MGVFCYISFVNFERVCRPNRMTQRLQIWYMGFLYGHKLIPEIFYQYSENNVRFCSKNLNCYKDSHVEILVNIICDLTKYRHFLNRNLSSIRRQSVYVHSKPTYRPPKTVLTNKRKHSDRLRVNINRRTDVTFHDYSNCIQ